MYSVLGQITKMYDSFTPVEKGLPTLSLSTLKRWSTYQSKKLHIFQIQVKQPLYASVSVLDYLGLKWLRWSSHVNFTQLQIKGTDED